MAIDVYATADAIEKDLRNHVCILVDVLRATSVISTAIEHNCHSVIPVLEVEDAVSMSRSFGRDRVLLCGERQSLPIEGFNLSNSPLEFTEEMVSGRVIVLTTTNGTRAIHKIGAYKRLLIGSFLNAEAVAKSAVSSGDNIAIICAGTMGRYSTDDILCAGSLISHMLDHSPKHTLCDLSRTALALYDSYKDDIYGALVGSVHFERLRSLGKEDDLRYCLQEDIIQAVPAYENGVIKNEADL